MTSFLTGKNGEKGIMNKFVQSTYTFWDAYIAELLADLRKTIKPAAIAEFYRTVDRIGRDIRDGFIDDKEEIDYFDKLKKLILMKLL